MVARNRDSIQWETLRKKVDVAIEELHDELEVCYYSYWKEGLSKPFFQWDVRNTSKNNKIQFDVLHGALFHIYVILQYKINELDGDYSSEAMFATYNDDGTVADPIGLVKRSRSWLADVGQQYGVDWSPVKDRVKTWVKNQLNKDITVD